MSKCFYCDGRLVELKVKQCSKNPDHQFYDINEVERVRKMINPTILERLRFR